MTNAQGEAAAGGGMTHDEYLTALDALPPEAFNDEIPF